MDIGQHTFAAKEGLDVPLFVRHGNTLVHVLLHLRIGSEVPVNQLLRLGARDVQSACQSERGDTVHDAEIGGLGNAALVGGHLGEGDAEDFGRSRRMDVHAVAERVDKMGVAAQVGHYPQLYLGIVGRQDHRAGSTGDEGLADLLAALRSDGDILKVRIGGR